MMFWNRLSIGKKLFAAISLSATIIVLAMSIMINSSMRTGFTHYLAQAEINNFDTLEKALAESHRPSAPSWPELSSSAQAWENFVHDNLEPRKPPHEARPIERGPQPPPDRALALTQRVSLFDASGKLIAGISPSGSPFLTRSIRSTAEGDVGKVLGQIGLFVPPGASGPTDQAFLRSQSSSVIWAALLAMVLSGIVAWFFSRQIVREFNLISEGADELALGNYTKRLSTKRQDEFGKLASDFNILAASLEAAEKAERQWMTDTSHELQTPLAILRAEIEAMQDGVRKPTAENISALHASVMRLSRLVGDINTLSRTREGSFPITLNQCDVSEVIRHSIEQAKAGIDATGLSLEMDIMKPMVIQCDENRILQVFDNLLENARRYTDAPGTIVVSSMQIGDEICILVEDSSPCPPANAIDRLLDRFYRVDGSRSRASGGSGLGLSICDAIVKAHKGSLSIERSKLGGIKVEIRLPITPN